MSSEYTRVYTEGGTIVHFLESHQSPNSKGEPALCGRSPWPGYWHGTGSQEEEEKALDLRVCVGCMSVIRHRKNGYLTR